MSARPPSLMRQLLLWQAIALLVAWMGLGLLVTSLVLGPGHGAVDQRLRDAALLLADAAALQADDPAAMAGHLDRMAPRLMAHLGWEAAGPAHPMVFQVHDAQGHPLHASQLPGQPALPPATSKDESHEFSDAQGRRWRGFSAWDPQRRVEVRVAEPASLAWTAIADVLMSTLGSQLGVFVWHGLVIWLSLRVGFKPLRQLAQRIADRPAGDLRPIVLDRLHAETAPVLREINALLARESTRLDLEHHFLADAAHELRTPLAAVSAQAHLLLQETDAQARTHAGQALRQGIERVSHLLTQLLTLAKADRQDVQPVHSSLDLAELVRQRVAQLSSLARARRMVLEVDAPPSLRVRGDAPGLCSVIDNLVDNALRHAPAGSPVTIHLSVDGPHAVLHVRDQGPGIPETERERVFERFYRMPGTTETGTGLGLAIVRRIVARHGGDIRFIDPQGAGALARLTWPL